MKFKRFVLSTAAAALLTVGAMATAMADDGGHKKDSHKHGGITLVAPVSLAANLCDINVNVLSKQVDKGDTTCVAMAQSNASTHGGGAGHKGRGSGGDVTVVIPVAVALNLCDINVNVLSQQADKGDTTCVAIAESNASADGGKMVRHGGKKRSGQTGSITVLVPVSIAANVCDINVNVLSRQAKHGDTTCVAVAESSASAHGGKAGHKAGHKDKMDAVTVLIPVSIAKNVCDVNVNVKSKQVDKGDTTCIAIAESNASADSGKFDKDRKDRKEKKHPRHDRKRVHVQAYNRTVQLPVAWAANICDVNANILSSQLKSGDVMCVAVASSRA